MILRRCIGRCFSVSVVPWISTATETIPRPKAKYCQRDGIKEQNNEANHDNGKEDEWHREQGFIDKYSEIRKTPTDGSDEGHSNINCPEHANGSTNLNISIKYLDPPRLYSNGKKNRPLVWSSRESRIFRRSLPASTLS